MAAKFPEAEDLCQFMYRVTPTTQSLDVNINKITNDLRRIKINKASGPDGISSRSLAIAWLSALEGILTILTNSMALTRFPSSWKIAKIKLIFKKRKSSGSIKL